MVAILEGLSAEPATHNILAVFGRAISGMRYYSATVFSISLGIFFIEIQVQKVEDGQGGQQQIRKEAVIFPRYHQLDAVKKSLWLLVGRD